MTTLAVDGDIIAYRIAAACKDEDVLHCYEVIDATIKGISFDTGIKKMRIYLSGENNFRYDIAVTKPYKGNRKKEKPEYLDLCREYLVRNYKAIVVDGYEADDAIASDMVQNGAMHCGQDKDLHQIAGKHYNYVKQEMVEISDDEAIINMCRQIITGDSVDNIPGLPGVGEVGAAKAITDAETARKDTIELYTHVCGEKMPGIDWFDYYEEQSKLITLVQDLDILDMVTHHVKVKGLNI